MDAKTYIKRDIFDEIKAHIPQKEISLLIGPRQVGKTTLMRLLQRELDTRGDKTVFLSLDFEQEKTFFSSQESLISKLSLELGSARRGYVFLDEIQRKEDAGLFLKGIYDRELPYKFIVSGSGSVELKEKVHESLAGRKRLFEVLPVSFKEFAAYRTQYRYEDRMADFFSLERQKTQRLLEEYLRFGGYPRVITAETEAEKLRLIDEIYRSYIERDISYFLKVEKLDAFSALVKILASQTGRLVRFSELAATIGISLATVKNYLWYLEKTFIITLLTPYFRNKRKEITKSPVVYFYDLGLRNYSLGAFGTPLRADDTGFLFQNFIFQILHQTFLFSGARLHFWRTKDKAEVDFMIEKGETLIPIEVKYTLARGKQAIGRSLRRFITIYHPKEAFIITPSLDTEMMVESTRVRFLPFPKIGELLL